MSQSTTIKCIRQQLVHTTHVAMTMNNAGMVLVPNYIHVHVQQLLWHVDGHFDKKVHGHRL